MRNDPRVTCPPKCTRRLLDIESPQLAGVGPIPADIMLIGEAPGQDEDALGAPFVGSSGQLLTEILHEVGIDRDDTYVTNAVKCATPVENMKPSKGDIKSCKPYLEAEIAAVKPNVICVIGNIAMEAVIGRTGILKLKNNIFYTENKIKVIPVLHPAYILRNPGAEPDLHKGLALVREESVSVKAVPRETIKKKRLDAKTPNEIDKVLSALEKVSNFAFDLETTSLHVKKADIICIALSWKIGLGVTIPWKALSKQQLNRLKAIFRSGKEKTGHNIKYDMQVLRTHKIAVKKPYFDTLPAMALINENQKDKTLDALTLRYTDLGEYWKTLDDFKAKYIKDNKITKDQFNYGMIPYDILKTYAQSDADSSYRLYKRFKKELMRQGLIDFYSKFTLSTLRRLMQMEYVGIRIDREKLNELIEAYTIKVENTLEELHDLPEVKEYEDVRKERVYEKLADNWENSKTLKTRFENVKDYINNRIEANPKILEPAKFNPGSPDQISELLFKRLNLPIIKYTDKKKPSTDVDVLTELATKHDVDFLNMILEYRRLQKYLSTYLVSIYNKSEFDGRIHPSYHQHIAVTGRTSSSNPNFQNIPRDAKDLKECFIADPGMTIVKADLAQAEFRCWAHYSADQAMLDDIHAGLDIHRKTASEVFGVPEEEVTKDQRTAAKNCVFGLMYGRGSKAIADQYGISIEEADTVRKLFFKKYPMASIWLDKQVAHAREFGHVKTWMGRIRRLPEIRAEDHMIRAEAERQSKNSPIQGLASDMNNYYMDLNLKLAKRRGIKCFPIGAIHDANLYLVKTEQVPDMIKVMKTVVKKAFPDFLCEMKLDFEVGDTLGTLKEVD
jgi:DNA polymerase-1